jgi:hypothetical protein
MLEGQKKVCSCIYINFKKKINRQLAGRVKGYLKI